MASKILNNLGTAGSQIGNSMLGVFGNKDAAAKAASTVVEAESKGRGVLGTAAHLSGRVASKPFRMAFNGGMYVVSRPFVWADAIGGSVIGGVGNFFAKNPKTALAGTAIVAGLGVGHVMNKRAERRAQNEINELEMAQLRVAQGQAQANTTVSPADYAAMEARMRQGGQNGGFAAGIQAERAAAQNVQGPAV